MLSLHPHKCYTWKSNRFHFKDQLVTATQPTPKDRLEFSHNQSKQTVVVEMLWHMRSTNADTLLGVLVCFQLLGLVWWSLFDLKSERSVDLSIGCTCHAQTLTVATSPYKTHSHMISYIVKPIENSVHLWGQQRGCGARCDRDIN